MCFSYPCSIFDPLSFFKWLIHSEPSLSFIEFAWIRTHERKIWKHLFLVQHIKMGVHVISWLSVLVMNLKICTKITCWFLKNSCQCYTKSNWNNSDVNFRWYSPYFSYDKVTRSYTFSCNLKWIRSCGGRLSFFKFWSKTSLCYALVFLILWELKCGLACLIWHEINTL